MQLQKEVKSNPKQPSCKKVCGFKKAQILVKRGEGNTNSPELSSLKILSLAITAISWPPPWISHLFSQWRVAPFFLQLGCSGLDNFKPI